MNRIAPCRQVFRGHDFTRIQLGQTGAGHENTHQTHTVRRLQRLPDRNRLRRVKLVGECQDQRRTGLEDAHDFHQHSQRLRQIGQPVAQRHGIETVIFKRQDGLVIEILHNPFTQDRIGLQSRFRNPQPDHTLELCLVRIMAQRSSHQVQHSAADRQSCLIQGRHGCLRAHVHQRIRDALRMENRVRLVVRTRERRDVHSFKLFRAAHIHSF